MKKILLIIPLLFACSKNECVKCEQSTRKMSPSFQTISQTKEFIIVCDKAEKEYYGKSKQDKYSDGENVVYVDTYCE